MTLELIDAAHPPLSARALDMAAELGRIVGPEHARVDTPSRLAAGRDMWPRLLLLERAGRIPVPPDVVVTPADVEQVAAVIGWARERGVPVTPHGAGSGVTGAAVPLHGGIALSLARLDRILHVDPHALTVHVQAGVNGWTLERALEGRGLTLGHFPASVNCSSVGGWIATRSAGQCSSRYGKIEDMVQGVTCVLGTGDVVRLRRPAPGPDLLELILGSEGTLGVVTDATFRLWPAPDRRAPRGFRFRSLRRGLEAMRAILRAGLRPAVMRLYDPLDTWMALRESGDGGDAVPPPTLADLRRPAGKLARTRQAALDAAMERPRVLQAAASLARSCLLVLVHEGSEREVEADVEHTRAVCEAYGARDLGEAPGRRWLRKRYAISYKLPAMFAAGTWVDTFEVATSWGGVGELHEAVREAVSEHAFVMAHFSHAYPDGCSIYFTFSGPAPDLDRGLASYDAAWKAALSAADRLGATITHHHGVGLLKGPWLGHEIGAGGLQLLAAAKRGCDPSGILNPGKLAT